MVCLDLLKFNLITLSTCTHAAFIRMLTSWCTVQEGYWCLEGWQRLLSFGTPARPCIHTYEGSGVKETAGHLKNSWHLLLLMTKNATTVDSNISSETWSRLSVQGFYQRCTISVHGCYIGEKPSSTEVRKKSRNFILSQGKLRSVLKKCQGKL